MFLDTFCHKILYPCLRKRNTAVNSQVRWCFCWFAVVAVATFCFIMVTFSSLFHKYIFKDVSILL